MTKIREIVLPGDPVDLKGAKARNGLYKNAEGVYCSSYFGVIQRGEQWVDVVPFTGTYMPRRGDKVIGKVIEIGPSMWITDIGAPYASLLHMNDVPWRSSPGDLKRTLNTGEFVYAKVLSTNEINESWLTLKDVGLRKLEGGSVISIPSPKVPRVIGKGGNMVNLIKDTTQTRIMVGQNGLIWLDGAPENVMLAISAIEMVKNEAHTIGLTDRIEEFLKSKKGETVGN
ncbi:MAG: exosome complex RNA-binding protein Rrp4 [Candidatus Thermoplasmatota archaeon]|jgi:exosome complex component RRP4|nr:exosome complex RNA-binding protein Rrp4 [Candidatus Thermoplasmatota archaeon]MCL5793348.1 exosome complex RNA-binding protein Rrp4 [Candidatus Thermoplasmatota archaeon]